MFYILYIFTSSPPICALSQPKYKMATGHSSDSCAWLLINILTCEIPRLYHCTYIQRYSILRLLHLTDFLYSGLGHITIPLGLGRKGRTGCNSYPSWCLLCLYSEVSFHPTCTLIPATTSRTSAPLHARNLKCQRIQHAITNVLQMCTAV